MAVWRLGDGQSGQEGAQSERQAERGRGHGHGQAEQERRHDEDLSDPGPDDAVEEEGDGIAGDGKTGQDGGQAQPEAGGQRADALSFRPRQERNHRQHGDEGQVLEEENAQSGAAVRRVDLAAVVEDLEHDGRAAQADQEPAENSRARSAADRIQKRSTDRGRQAGLEQPAPEKIPAERPEPAERKFQADRKKKHDDADFGQQIDARVVAHQGQSGRADEDAGQDEAGHGGKLKTAAEQDDSDGGGQDDQQLAEERQVGHRPHVNKRRRRRPLSRRRDSG